MRKFLFLLLAVSLLLACNNNKKAEKDDKETKDTTGTATIQAPPAVNLLEKLLGSFVGAFGDNKLDWLVGAEYDLGKGFAAGVSYLDSYRSALREGRAGVVANLRFEF